MIQHKKNINNININNTYKSRLTDYKQQKQSNKQFTHHLIFELA